MINYHSDTTWAGVTDAASEGKWVFAGGQYAGDDVGDLMPWGPNEPGGMTGENCAAFSTNIIAYDIPCHNTYKYIIEFSCPFGQRFNNQGSACIGMYLCV